MTRRILILAAAALAATTASAALRTSLAPLGRAANDGLPSGYTACEYLQSSGTQYIDTGVYAIGTKTRVDLDGSIVNLGRSFVGVNPLFTITTNPSGYVMFRYNNRSVSTALYSGARHIFIFDPNGCSVDNILCGSFSPASFVSTQTMLLFARHTAAGSVEEKMRGSIYSVKFYEDTSLVRDYIPALDRDGVPCMYDRVTKQPFYNQGTGAFLYKIKE